MGGVGPPKPEELENPSGGGRGPGNAVHNFSHSNATPLFEFAPEAYHSPLNSALRFSPKALMPSLASCDTKTRLIASRSMASPTSSGVP